MIRGIRFLNIFLTMVFLIVCTAHLFAADKVDLKLRLKPGNTFKTRIVNIQVMKQSMMGQEMEMNQKITFDMAFRVLRGSDSGNATLETTFQAIKMEMDGQMGKMSYNSSTDSEPENPMLSGFSAIVGQSFTMTLTPEGKVVNVDGMQNIVERMIEKMKAPNEQAKEMMKSQYKKMFGKNGMQDKMGQMFNIFPDRPVGVGDSWSIYQNASNDGLSMNMKKTFTLKERRVGIAVIAVKTELESDPDAAPMEMGPVSIKMNVSGTQEGTLEMEEATGWIIGGRMNQSMSGEQTVMGAPSGDMTIPVSMNNEITWEPF